MVSNEFKYVSNIIPTESYVQQASRSKKGLSSYWISVLPGHFDILFSYTFMVLIFFFNIS